MVSATWSSPYSSDFNIFSSNLLLSSALSFVEFDDVFCVIMIMGRSWIFYLRL